MEIVYIAFFILIIVIAIVSYISLFNKTNSDEHDTEKEEENNDLEAPVDWFQKSMEISDYLKDLKNLSANDLTIYKDKYYYYKERILNQLEVHKEVKSFVENPTTYKIGFDIRQRLYEVSPFSFMLPNFGLFHYSEGDYKRELKESLERKAYWDIKEELNYNTESRDIKYFKSILDKWTFSDNDVKDSKVRGFLDKHEIKGDK